MSRLIDTLAGDAERRRRGDPAWPARAARAGRGGIARRSARRRPVVVDLDATLVLAHSEKEGATPTFKRTFGFHPLLAFVDHGTEGTGEPLAGLLREGRATRQRRRRPDQRCSTPRSPSSPRRSAAGCWSAAIPAPARTRSLEHVAALGLEYSVGVYARSQSLDALAALPPQRLAGRRRRRRRPARGRAGRRAHPLPACRHRNRLAGRDADHRPPGTPAPRRAAAHHRRRRLADHLFATNTNGGRLADLELRHRMRARAEDRIRGLKDSGLRNLPLHEFTKNVIWLELVQLAAELLTWTQTLAFPGSIAQVLGTQTAPATPPARRRPHHHHQPAGDWLRLPRGWPWTDLIITGHARLHALT